MTRDSNPDDGDTAIGGGSGRGGTLGTPSSDSTEAPPSQDSDENVVVSGGGVARPSEDSGESEAREDRRASGDGTKGM